MQIITLTDLEHSMDFFINLVSKRDVKKEAIDEAIEVLELMKDGLPSYEVSVQLGISSFNGMRQINKVLKKVVTNEELDEILKIYNRIWYFDIFFLKDDEIFNKFPDYMINKVYKLTLSEFIWYARSPITLFENFISDRELMAFLFAKETQNISLFELKNKYNIDFSVERKVASWLKVAHLKYGVYHYIDTDNNKSIVFGEYNDE